MDRLDKIEEFLINALNNPKQLPFGAWMEHIPFGYFLISFLKPKVFVELGVYKGCSFLNICQAIKDQGIQCNAYGVDSWLGDSHAGVMTEETFFDINNQVNSQYGTFAKLLKKSFDEAACEFMDKSIDLLHIDGYHTYESVSHDFETWLPKVSENGVVLFHDTAVRENDFGVWKLWDELKIKYPHISTQYGYGLGVLFVGKVSNSQKEFIDLFNTSPFYCRFFQKMGLYLKENYELKEMVSCRIEEIVEKNKQLEDVKNELVSIHLSKSWRWTRPFREIQNIWRAVKGKK